MSALFHRGVSSASMPGRGRGSLASFSNSVWSPSGGSFGSREESYHLLLELCSQEPTMQCCFKIIESTCLARGINMLIGGKPPTEEFRTFLNRYYLPFAESSIRYFFATGFVPWRLRKLSTGDVAPEVIPLGIFTWSIESITNRISKGEGSSFPAHGNASSKIGQKFSGVEQIAAQKAFEKRKAYFSDPKRVPYRLQGDLMRMENKSDASKDAAKKRLQGYAQQITAGHQREGRDDKQHHHHKPPKRGAGEMEDADNDSSDDNAMKKKKAFQPNNTPAFFRQQRALQRMSSGLLGRAPADDDETKILRYTIKFTENCEVMEDEVEIYEYMAPTNSITRCSVLYGTVPSPLSHILIDYRNIRTTLIRQAYADSFNTQAKMVCSYTAAKNIYNVSEGGPILNNEGWAPQQRLGLHTDTNLPTEIEANAYTRDAITETVVASKSTEHKPIVYSLPKNTGIEPVQKLESIIDVPTLQVCSRPLHADKTLFCFFRTFDF